MRMKRKEELWQLVSDVMINFVLLWLHCSCICGKVFKCLPRLVTYMSINKDHSVRDRLMILDSDSTGQLFPFFAFYTTEPSMKFK